MKSKGQAILKMECLRLAIESIENKKDITDEVRKKYGLGASASEQYFGFSFAAACAEQATIMIDKNEWNFKDAIKSIYNATKILNDECFAYSLDCFIKKIENSHPSFFNNGKLKETILEEVKSEMNNTSRVFKLI